MLYLAAFHTGTDSTPDPRHVMPLPPSVTYPADLAEAWQSFRDFVDAAAAAGGSGTACRAAWSRPVAGPGAGVPDRAPGGLAAALAAGRFSSAPWAGAAGGLPMSIAPSSEIAPSGDRSFQIAPSSEIAPISFRFSGSGLGMEWYLCTRGRESTRLEIRVRAGADERRISTATDAEWSDEIVWSVGVLRYGSDPSKAVPGTILNAYNRWQLGKYVQDIADIAADPDKYGTQSLGELAKLAPMVAHAAYWTPQGWRRV